VRAIPCSLVIAVWVLGVVVLRAECRTVLDIPCHTIEYQDEQTTYFHRSFTDLSTISIQSTHAVGADGSSYSEEVVRDGYGFTGRVNSTRSIWIYSAPSNRIFVVFPQERTYSVRMPSMWHDRPYRRSKIGDATCSSGILHSGTDFRLTSFETVLGLRTVRWHRDLGNGGYEDVWLAPDLDCAGLRHAHVIKNWLHLPTFINTSEATRVDLSRPDPDLFGVPSGYREIATHPLFRLQASR
jgi:hypothetical protein